MKEREKVLVVGFGRVIKEKVVNCSIIQLFVSLAKIIILVEDHSSTALVCHKDMDVRIGLEGVEDLGFKRG